MLLLFFFMAFIQFELVNFHMNFISAEWCMLMGYYCLFCFIPFFFFRGNESGFKTNIYINKFLSGNNVNLVLMLRW